MGGRKASRGGRGLLGGFYPHHVRDAQRSERLAVARQAAAVLAPPLFKAQDLWGEGGGEVEGRKSYGEKGGGGGRENRENERAGHIRRDAHPSTETIT